MARLRICRQSMLLLYIYVERNSSRIHQTQNVYQSTNSQITLINAKIATYPFDSFSNKLFQQNLINFRIGLMDCSFDNFCPKIYSIYPQYEFIRQITIMGFISRMVEMLRCRTFR